MSWSDCFCVHSLPLRFWVNILRNPHFIFDVHVTEVVEASLHVISQTFMDACTKTEHKLSRVSHDSQTFCSWWKLAAGEDDYWEKILYRVFLSFCPTVGVSQQQTALCKRDFHIQEDGGRVSEQNMNICTVWEVHSICSVYVAPGRSWKYLNVSL